MTPSMKRMFGDLMTSMTTMLMPWVILLVMTATIARSNDEIPQEGTNTATINNFVEVTKQPQFLQSRNRVNVTYYCQSDVVIVLDVTAMVFGTDSYSVVYTKSWKCRGQGEQGRVRSRSFRLRLPARIAFRPDFFNRDSDVVISAKIRIAMVTGDDYKKAKASNQLPFLRGNNQQVWEIRSLPPYSRPSLSPPCRTWYWTMVQRYSSVDESLRCPQEPERMALLNYPAVFNGAMQSIIRTVPAFKNLVLERDRMSMYRRPRFSVEVWLYIIDYCPRHDLTLAKVCGIVLHTTPMNGFLTPAILISVDGHIQIDVHSPTNYKGVKTLEVVPKHTWTRLFFAMDFRTWNLYVNYGPQMSHRFQVSYTYDEEVLYNDSEGLYHIGGLGDTLGSFVGYVGKVTLYRGRAMVPAQLTPIDSYHPMYELGLTSRDKRCQNFLSWLTSTVRLYTDVYRYKQTHRPDQCPSPWRKAFLRESTCPTGHPHRQQQYRHVNKLLKRAVFSQRVTLQHVTKGTLEAYGLGGGDKVESLYNVSRDAVDKALKIMSKRGVRKARHVMNLFKQSACLGNDDAMFYLAAMLNNGVGVTTDEIQSLAYFMLGALNGHTLSSMALGFRHSMGLDGAPRDFDMSYMYYKIVADKCRRDREEHKDSGYQTEKIRLIDEKLLSVQTSEVEDLFLWIKDQAAKGVQSARSDLAELMYWGKQGIQRNLNNALNAYREGAQEGNVKSMYNYGLMQYRGIGGKKNKTEGAEMMKRAAEKKSPDALNALGWIALEVDKNYTEAERLFRLVKSLNHMDGGYYLGHMYMLGYIPDSGVDHDKALKELEWSARRDQIHAGTLYSYLLSRGTPKYPRNIDFATQWVRYIAEQNGDLGQPLRQAVDAYRHGHLEKALYLYLVLAETGLEVASFNLAYLCELNIDGVTSYISKECQWRHYNLTIQREFKDVDSYSFIKMGDYYWYGCLKTRNDHLAARYYAMAVLKNDPQALFNLAYMVEEGITIPTDVLSMIGLHPTRFQSTDAILMELYSRCRESKKSEAYLPCTLALTRIQVLSTWRSWCRYFNVASLVGVVAACIISVFVFYQWVVLRLRRIGTSRRDRMSPFGEIPDGEGFEEDENRMEEEGGGGGIMENGFGVGRQGEDSV